MKLVIVSSKGFERLWNRLKGSYRTTSTEYSNARMADEWEGTDRHVKELLNPSKPSRILYHTSKGSYEVVSK